MAKKPSVKSILNKEKEVNINNLRDSNFGEYILPNPSGTKDHLEHMKMGNISCEGLKIEDTTLSFTDDWEGITVDVTKTGGVSGAGDTFQGFTSTLTFDQVGGIVGDTRALRGNIVQDEGTIFGVAIGNTTYLDLNAGSVIQWVRGYTSKIAQAAAHTIGGDVHGMFLSVDCLGTVTGTTYIQYLDEGAGVDYALYHDGTATSHFGGKVEVLSLDLNGALLTGVNIALELPNNASSTGWADMTDNVLLTHMNDNWEDSSGEENDGTATGALFTMNSKLGTHAGSFDGANDYVTIADNASLDITGELTISFWAKYTADIDSNHGLVSKYLGNDGVAVNKRGFAVAQNATGGVQFVISSDGTFANSTSVSYATSLGTTWKHIVVSYDPSTYMRIYIDGTQVAENTTSIPASIFSGDMDLWIGMQFANSAGFRFPGLIDEVAIWSRLLTSTEISDIYDAQATGEKGLYVAHGVSAEGFTVRSPKIKDYKNDFISKIPIKTLNDDGKLNLEGVYSTAKKGNEMDIGQIILTNSLLIAELKKEIDSLKKTKGI